MAPRALAAHLPRITKAVLAKSGRDYAALIAEWPSIVGKALAESSLPEKLSRGRQNESGVLTLRVSGGAAMEFQHREPQIIERINAYLGKRAVDRIRLVQAPIPGRKPRGMALRRALTPTEERAITGALDGVTDSELRARLERFGRSLAAGQKRPGTAQK